MSLEVSAHKFSNGFVIFLKKSRPPRKTIRPIVTTICINNLFLLGIKIAIIDRINIGNPKKEGINEVIELLSVITVIHNPQVIRKAPYTIEIFSIFSRKKVYSLFINNVYTLELIKTEERKIFQI
tara:strand:+ start:380 stop:754 length:375 start_codon:yes stop_codon:yes gene_type:complete